jgi:hypothetical protein
MQTYTGGCHCGDIRYEVQTNLEGTIACNCSHCAIKGLLLKFVPAEFFTLTHGDESTLTEYRFNKHHIRHLFCPVCGVQSYSRGTGVNDAEMIAINVRCLDDVEADALEVTKFDGKKL